MGLKASRLRRGFAGNLPPNQQPSTSVANRTIPVPGDRDSPTSHLSSKRRSIPDSFFDADETHSTHSSEYQTRSVELSSGGIDPDSSSDPTESLSVSFPLDCLGVIIEFVSVGKTILKLQRVCRSFWYYLNVKRPLCASHVRFHFPQHDPPPSLSTKPPLILPYVTKLHIDTPGCRSWDGEEIFLEKKRLRHFPNVRSLMLGETYIDGQCLSLGFRHLERVTFEKACVDIHTRHLLKFGFGSRITSLTIDNIEGNVGGEILGNLPVLEKLVLIGVQDWFDEKDFGLLPNPHLLRIFILACNDELTDAIFQTIGAHLQEVELDSCTRMTLDSLSSLQRVEFIRIVDCWKIGNSIERLREALFSQRVREDEGLLIDFDVGKKDDEWMYEIGALEAKATKVSRSTSLERKLARDSFVYADWASRGMRRHPSSCGSCVTSELEGYYNF